MRSSIVVGIYLLLVLLMYIPPYTILASSRPLVLYAYWTAIALLALAFSTFALKEQEKQD